MNALSLFSGVGGFDIGFERAGIKTVAFAENDPKCSEVLKRHWPDTPNLGDVSSIARSGPTIDLIHGGFPCQDLSVAGKRAGLGGERSGLWVEFQRILSELRPRWAVIENVSGLLSGCGCRFCEIVRLRRREHSERLPKSDRPCRCPECRAGGELLEAHSGHNFGIVLAGLVELGYCVGWATLDAQHFGVPQRRRRVFIVGGPSRSAVEQVLSICESCGGNPETGKEAGEDVAGPLGSGSTAGERGYRNDLDSQGAYISGAVSAKWSKGTGGPAGDEAYNLVEADTAVRRLTPLECERLMGWPDDWTRWDSEGNEIADSHRYRMCGNGVVATVAEWIGRRIVAADADS